LPRFAASLAVVFLLAPVIPRRLRAPRPVCMCMCLSICSAYLPFLSFDSVDFMRIMVRRGMAWHNLKVLVRLVPLILAFFGFRHQVGPPLQLHSAAIMLCSVLNALPKVGSEKTPNMYLVPVFSPHWQLSHSSLQCSPDPSSYVRENTSIPCVFGPPYLPGHQHPVLSSLGLAITDSWHISSKHLTRVTKLYYTTLQQY